MNLQDLRYLVTLARERHFRRAAELCFITQPALSLSIRKLEDELGVTVFERLRNDITITPIGQRLIEQAQRVLDEANQLTALANAAQDPLQGVLRLGVIHTVGPYLLPELIPALHRSAAFGACFVPACTCSHRCGARGGGGPQPAGSRENRPGLRKRAPADRPSGGKRYGGSGQ